MYCLPEYELSEPYGDRKKEKGEESRKIPSGVSRPEEPVVKYTGLFDADGYQDREAEPHEASYRQGLG
jgi:intein/homing endonuclease